MDTALDDKMDAEEACFERMMRHKYADGKFLCQGCTRTSFYKTKRWRKKCKGCGKSQPKLKKNKNAPFKCQRCTSTNAEEICGPIILECAHCGKQTTLTAGTVFHGAKISLSTIAHILSDMGRGLIKSAAMVAAEVGVAISTAYTNMQKARHVMDETVTAEKKMEEVPRSFFQKILFRRSTESPSTFDGETLSQFEARHNGETAPVELLEHSSAPKMYEFVELGAQGTSGKQLQPYAGQFNYVACYADQPEKLIDLCFQAKQITNKELACYSSPKLIKVVIRKLNGQQQVPLVSEAASGSEWGFVASGAAHQLCLAWVLQGTIADKISNYDPAISLNRRCRPLVCAHEKH